MRMSPAWLFSVRAARKRKRATLCKDIVYDAYLLRPISPLSRNARLETAASCSAKSGSVCERQVAVCQVGLLYNILFVWCVVWYRR